MILDEQLSFYLQLRACQDCAEEFSREPGLRLQQMTHFIAHSYKFDRGWGQFKHFGTNQLMAELDDNGKVFIGHQRSWLNLQSENVGTIFNLEAEGGKEGSKAPADQQYSSNILAPELIVAPSKYSERRYILQATNDFFKLVRGIQEARVAQYIQCMTGLDASCLYQDGSSMEDPSVEHLMSTLMRRVSTTGDEQEVKQFLFLTLKDASRWGMVDGEKGISDIALDPEEYSELQLTPGFFIEDISDRINELNGKWFDFSGNEDITSMNTDTVRSYLSVLFDSGAPAELTSNRNDFWRADIPDFCNVPRYLSGLCANSERYPKIKRNMQAVLDVIGKENPRFRDLFMSTLSSTHHSGTDFFLIYLAEKCPKHVVQQALEVRSLQTSSLKGQDAKTISALENMLCTKLTEEMSNDLLDYLAQEDTTADISMKSDMSNGMSI